MFKIKLLIFLPISILFISCVPTNQNLNNLKYSIDYISGEYDGVILKNKLFDYLNSLEIYDNSSNFKIKSNVLHINKLYITNIDNTSDREEITTSINFKIVDQVNDCVLYNQMFEVSQFYIFASSEKFLSNKEAVEKIKSDNTEILVKQLINKIKYININCDET